MKILAVHDNLVVHDHDTIAIIIGLIDICNRIQEYLPSLFFSLMRLYQQAIHQSSVMRKSNNITE
ncbi:hypothetical protein A0J61_09955 [Choanephora cucurbitarum]|uniref:Uncharacterized protein n=1 Tax=Choanephora cucurbitarum TaxID=101091 RepID=A0A1C7MZZ9_9FUNG|nr:hypothetical protein A0J61_09955 [Choanephora cucurbitarum]